MTEPTLVDGLAIATALDIKPGTIRQWAARGLITRRGTDHAGRALYDLDQVEQRANRARSAT